MNLIEARSPPGPCRGKRWLRGQAIALAGATAVLALAASAAEQLPSFPSKTSYDEARRSLLALGWTPVTLMKAAKCSSGDKRCEGRPEMMSCSGTVLARCSFTWKRQDTLIEVHTLGDTNPKVEGVRCRAGCRGDARSGSSEPVGQTGETTSTLELSDLISMLMTKAGHLLNWATGADKGTPILWHHDGIQDCAPYLSKEHGLSFCRTGSVVITNRGKATHSVLGRTIEPGRWQITLLGGHAGVRRALISSERSSPEIRPELLEGAAASISVQLIRKCGISAPTALFRLRSAGKENAYVIQTLSCGSGGCSAQLTLMHDANEANELIQLSCSLTSD